MNVRQIVIAHKSMTDENASAWAAMGITKELQIKRITDWANMLERRVAEFDPLYRAYPFGRIDTPNERICQCTDAWTGTVDGVPDADCPQCGGTGKFLPNEPEETHL